MFNNLVLLILICQYNCAIASTKKQAMQKRATPKLFDAFENLLTNDCEHFNSIISIAHYPLKATMQDLIPKDFFGRSFNRTSTVIKPLCIFCKVTATFFIKHCRSDASNAFLKNFAYFICSLTIHLLDETVCRHLVDIYVSILIYIGRNSKSLTGEKVCAIILQPYGCYREHSPQWIVHIPQGHSIKRFIKKEKCRPKPFKVLQISDPHVDSLYLPGATARCGKPLCCQKDQGRAVDGAGYWADYRSCDMPWHTMEDLLDHVVETNKKPKGISYVYFIGDIISHRVWQTTVESNTKEIKKMFRMLRKKLGSIPVFPILGNHESHPLNVFSPFSVPDNLSTKWLYDLAAEEWSVWLPKSALATIRTGGYYTVLVRPGFRIIALNSNVCYTMNWWLLYENIDLYGQLEWLIQELLKAEEANEAVHILSHHSPGDEECLTAWAGEFQKIVERFAHTITAHFNGHAHIGQLKVFYNSSNISQPVNVAYGGGSFTAYTDVNPSYRIYCINSKTFRVTNYKEWIFQVPLANFFPDKPPNWYPLYSFKHAYRLKNLRLHSLDYLVQRLAVDERIAQKYNKFKILNSETGMTNGCDKQCMKDNICSVVTTAFGNGKKCEQLTAYNYLKNKCIRKQY